jgi:hypothetical protein
VLEILHSNSPSVCPLICAKLHIYGGSKHVSFFGHVPFLCFSSSKHNMFIVTSRSMHMHGKYNSRIRNTDPGSWKTVFDHDENYQVYVFFSTIYLGPCIYKSPNILSFHLYLKQSHCRGGTAHHRQSVSDHGRCACITCPTKPTEAWI